MKIKNHEISSYNNIIELKEIHIKTRKGVILNYVDNCMDKFIYLIPLLFYHEMKR